MKSMDRGRLNEETKPFRMIDLFAYAIPVRYASIIVAYVGYPAKIETTGPISSLKL